jgi:tRNA(adenine34) deaminase
MDDRIPLSQADAEALMGLALAEAARAEGEGEVPVGCVIVRSGEVIATGRNHRERSHDPTGHAEMQAIRAAAALLGSWRLDDCLLVVTLEPCAMCAGAMVNARISGCVYGCGDPKGGFMGSLGSLNAIPALNHRFPAWAGVREAECSEQLKSFFRSLRRKRIL